MKNKIIFILLFVTILYFFNYAIYNMSEKFSNNTSIIFGGDVMIGRLFNDKHTNFNPFGNTLSFLNSANMVVGNLETTITNSTKKWANKAFNYKAKPTESV